MERGRSFALYTFAIIMYIHLVTHGVEPLRKSSCLPFRFVSPLRPNESNLATVVLHLTADSRLGVNQVYRLQYEAPSRRSKQRCLPKLVIIFYILRILFWKAPRFCVGI